MYGLLLAYALYFPNRLIYMYFVFPIPVRIFVLIMGGLAFMSSISDNGGGVANATHLGGLLGVLVDAEDLDGLVAGDGQIELRAPVARDVIEHGLGVNI